MNKEKIRKLTGVFTKINAWLPKSAKKIVFYSNMGFRDNVKAVYDYLLTCPGFENFKIVCSVSDYKQMKRKPHPKNVRFLSPLFGVFHFLTGKYFFYSFGKYPIKPSKRQMVINLWHGSPLKKIGNYLDDEDQNFFTYVLAASDFFVPIMQKSFSCDPSQVVVCGHPRNDALYGKNDALKQLGLDGGYNKIFLWLPTFRRSSFLGVEDTEASFGQTGMPILGDPESMAKVNEQLALYNSILVAKIHPAQDLNSIHVEGFSNIRVFTNEEMQQKECNLYELLADADALITDYSSVYFDYLLLNRPIGFTADDMEEYMENRGFVVEDPYSLMPGQVIRTPEDFSLFLSGVLSGNDNYRSAREEVNRLVNRYHDGKDCKRVLELAGIL